MKRLIALCVLAMLAGCANPIAAVDAAQVTLSAAETTGSAYKALPACVAGGSKVCSDPTKIAEAQRLDNIAYATVVSARTDAEAGKPVNVLAVNSAVAAFQAYVTALPTK